MRTLPKKAGTIFLSLRELGFFCIKSHLQGCAVSVKLIIAKKATPRYNKERRMTLMKKLARLTALLLTGALLLVLTACGAVTETEQQAKQRLLGEINSYRASIQLAPLVEVKQLSDAEQVWAEQFRAAGKTALPESETGEVFDRWYSMTNGWSSYDDFGWGLDRREDGKFDILSAKVPANTPEGKAELLKELRDSGTFDYDGCKHVGIAVVTIDRQMYWTCTVFYN